MTLPHTQPTVTIIGAGLAGSEAALQLANAGVNVTLIEMKPNKRSAAHHSNHFAEIVCSNSLGNLQTATASGLLKAEMETLGSALLQLAKKHSVPAGNALAVDREGFSKAVTEAIHQNPNITCLADEATQINPNEGITLIATGPLTTPALSHQLQQLIQEQHLAFFDAAAPIVTTDSINFDIAFYQDRYNKSASTEGNDPSETNSNEGAYINCPFNKEEYDALINFILAAEKAPHKAFEEQAMTKACFFESCLPIEELARRGHDTPRFGPMKPVGITDPRTDRFPYAVVQLRQDNLEGTLYNLVGFQTSLKWGEQKEMISLIPGLENAEIVRYGVMHQNTFINSPKVLLPTLQLKNTPNVLVAGQLTGVEGYTECIASGLVAAQSIMQLLNNCNAPQLLPAETMLGSLVRYITRDGVENFQPINSNWGILPALPEALSINANGKRIKLDKRSRNEAHANRALEAITRFQSPLKQPVLTQH